MQILTVKTRKKEEVIDISKQIIELANRSEVEDGACLVYVPHTTCAVLINENDNGDIFKDIIDSLDKSISIDKKYRHNCNDNNATAHIKSSLIGPSKIIPISQGKLKLGKWQSISLIEFDGPREREVYIEFLNR